MKGMDAPEMNHSLNRKLAKTVKNTSCVKTLFYILKCVETVAKAQFRRRFLFDLIDYLSHLRGSFKIKLISVLEPTSAALVFCLAFTSCLCYACSVSVFIVFNHFVPHTKHLNL